MIEEIEPYIKDVKKTVIASSENNQPWTATIFYCYDKELNFYFISAMHRRHSQEFLKNPKCSLSIAPDIFDMGDKVKGIQVEGDCIVLEGEEAQKAFNLYKERFSKASELIDDEEMTNPVDSFPEGEVIPRMWKVTPRKFKIFDEIKYGSVGKELQI